MNAETPKPPRVWWSPTRGLWQQLDAVGDEAVYRTFSHESGASFAVGGLPADAIELTPEVAA